jgi:serine/threonine protein kinase
VASSILPHQRHGDLTGYLVLGRYRIVRPLARGGMGMVYLGRVEGAEGFAKPVVIKSVLPAFGHRESEQAFVREARIVADLQHPRIVAVIDFGQLDASHVMVLEYVHGYHLGYWSRFVTATRGKLPVPLAVHVVQRVLEALNFAHARARPDGTPLGIVHRDVTPANVLIDVQGNVKLSDFGIARTADDEFRTQQGLFRGTLAFGAPEAVQGAEPSPKMDQHATALILYQLLAGANPFKGDAQNETINRVLNHVPPPLASLRDDIPPGIDSAVARALAKDPQQRFPSVADFARALRESCTWSELDAAERFASQIAEDFDGAQMAESLGLESLQTLDAAWREWQRSQQPQPLYSKPSSATVLIEASGRADGPADRARAPLEMSKPAAARSPVLWIGLAAVAAGAGAASVITFIPRPTSPAAKVLVIEKEQGPRAPSEPSPRPLAAPAAPSAGSTAEPAAAPSDAARPRPPVVAAAPTNRGAQLGRAFQSREPYIHGCFREHAGEVDPPQLSVTFQVDSAGAVQHAALNPAALSGTALGRCVLGVATGTQFGAQPEALSFTIPIAARIVRR